MPVTKKTIIIEDRLEEIFSYLPTMSFDVSGEKFPVTFGYGDELSLNGYLANREENSVYPLVWMLYPLEENHKKTRLIVDGLELIAAVNTNSSMENKERISLTFGKVLMPLLDNIRFALKSANIATLGDKDENFKVVKYPNYSKTDAREENATIAIWDAIKITVDLEVISTCLNPIKFS